MEELKLSFKAPLERINGPGGWWYVRVPAEIHEVVKPLMVRGSLRLSVEIGKTQWNATTMPLGGGVSMIPIKVEIRKAERLEEGQQLSVTITPREL